MVDLQSLWDSLQDVVYPDVLHGSDVLRVNAIVDVVVVSLSISKSFQNLVSCLVL